MCDAKQVVTETQPADLYTDGRKERYCLTQKIKSEDTDPPFTDLHSQRRKGLTSSLKILTLC